MHHSRLVLSAATFAYFAAVMQRSSLGVASLPAVERFHVSASALAALAVFQLIVYAAMQIPVGILLDRFGAKSLLAVGAAGMLLGQLAVAASTSIEQAYLGRMLVGMGDAFTFISMLRLIVDWLPSNRTVRIQQLMVNLGQLGQMASAIPFAIALANFGWSSAFEMASSISALSLVVILLFIRNTPRGIVPTHHSMTLRLAMNQLVENVRFSGTRMSFWIHFTLQSSGSVFALLWGVPFLVAGQGRTREFASAMLTLQFVMSVVFGFAVGWLAQHHPRLRTHVVYVVSILIMSSWTTLALLPHAAPTWLLVALVIVISAGGPASILAMDYSRTFIAKERLGSANGFINVGGFLATFVMMWLAGLILDAVQSQQHSTTAFTFTGFRFAMSIQVLILGFGLAMYSIERKRTKRTHLL